MTKSDLVLIFTPFLLTAVLIVVGYSVLVSTTPEASIAPAKQPQNTVELLEDSDIKKFSLEVPRPTVIRGIIAPLPRNIGQLNQVIDRSKTEQANTIYISVPVTLNADNTFYLTERDASSDENILKWAKKTISEAHRNNLQVYLSLSINATQTVSDFPGFTQSYLKFVENWASLANEYQVSFFSPGLTLGHALYSQFTPAQLNTLTVTLERAIRVRFGGLLGINICCTKAIPSTSLAGFSVTTIIPTPEYNFSDMYGIIDHYDQQKSVSYVLLYDREKQLLLSNERPAE